MTKTAIFIPARYHSTRFPGKPLTMLGDKTMIARVVEGCLKTGRDVFVLTDNKTIAMAAKSAGAEIYIDSSDYQNGTERCAGAVASRKFTDYDQFINVQGDMPDVTVEMIEKAEWMLKHYTTSTVVTQMLDERLNDPNSVKLVRAGDKVLWCGRGMTGYGDWHLGVYGYRRNALQSYPHLMITREERQESLEQLRWLKNGWDMGVLPVDYNGIEINTPEDAERWNESR